MTIMGKREESKRIAQGRDQTCASKCDLHSNAYQLQEVIISYMLPIAIIANARSLRSTTELPGLFVLTGVVKSDI